ncbi:hypothetical protein CDAR_410011 [Caerostris darwini]|uniref:Uncharacterized protein n=1 Tax=Caerostris darwini TaxID=1538125 RepID=A0AAV4VZ69_9ARAC|nr:hypothetical protein CDAR_410011 [Caerostris darwini]
MEREQELVITEESTESQGLQNQSTPGIITEREQPPVITEESTENQGLQNQSTPSIIMEREQAPVIAEESTDSQIPDEEIDSILASMHSHRLSMGLPPIYLFSAAYIRMEFQEYYRLRKLALQLSSMKVSFLNFVLHNFISTIDLASSLEDGVNFLACSWGEVRSNSTLQDIQDSNARLKDFSRIVIEHISTAKVDYACIIKKLQAYMDQKHSLNSDLYLFLARFFPRAFEKWPN